MRSKSRRKISVFVFQFLLLLHAMADDAVLTLPGEAKGAALGEAYSAAASGADGLWYNPATLSRSDVPTVSVMHTTYIERITFNTLGAVYPFGNRNAVGAGISYLNAGSVPSYDNTGAPASSYSPNDLVGRVGVSKSIAGTSFGLSTFFLRSTIADSAATFGFNAGLHQVLGPFSLAFVAENYGGKLTYQSVEESLPSRLRTGFAVRLLPSLNWNTDIVKPTDGSPWLGTGAETTFDVGRSFEVALRAGFNTRSQNDVKGLHGISAGAGFGWSGSSLNYAWIPFGDLGQTHRLSLDIEVGNVSSPSEYSKQELRQKTLIKRESVASPTAKGAPVNAAALPIYPWKTNKGIWRSSKEKLMDILARDALCSRVGARALVTNTRGTVSSASQRDLSKWTRMWAGKYLFEGDMLRTSELSYAQMVYANGVKAEVHPNSQIKIKIDVESCDRAVTSLEKGTLAAVSEEGHELRVETPLGAATVKNAEAQVGFDGKQMSVRMRSGTGVVSADGVETPIKPHSVFTKSFDGKTQMTADTSPDPVISSPITVPESRRIPGRWDDAFAKKFKFEVMRLDSIPGLTVNEYVRDTTVRKELSRQLLNQVDLQKELRNQEDGYQKDVSDFEALATNLKKTVSNEDRAAANERRANLKKANFALSNARKSLQSIHDELVRSLRVMRKNQEFLATIPIVRMLNITAQESTIPFATGRAMVPEESTATLDMIADSITQMKPFRIVVQGHTDRTGSDAANRRLSKQRADAVALYLRRKTGFPGRQFTTQGKGSAMPLVVEDTPEAMAKNRRVEIWFELRGL